MQSFDIMKYKFHIFLLLAALLFAGCEKKGPDAGEKNIPGYKELLAAYDAGQMYKEVLKSDGANTVVFDDDVFIGDDAVEEDVRADVGILQEDAIFQGRTLTDVDVTEEDAVFHSTFDHAAVCQEAVFDF